jgi:hypothetical protein
MSDAQPRETAGGGLQGRDRVLAQIEEWRKELVNLARSNRLLNYRDTKSSTLGIVREENETTSIVKHLLDGRAWRFFAPPEDESDTTALIAEPDELITDKKDEASLLRTLRTLDRRAIQESMDKGLWILYLAAGMLRWVDPETTEASVSPLVLIPVTLHRENPREPYRMTRVDEDIVANPALALKLAEYGITVPPLEDSDDLDLDEYLGAVRAAVVSRPNWSVSSRLVISHFSFHKEVMYRDLEVNVDEIADHPIVQALVLGSEEGSSLDFEPLPEEQIDELGRPKDGATVLPADATQRQCITASVTGQSFVMDGPPGTGKSQTIANMIAENIASGRTVLFVSEKAAALEVVETRMRQVGLGDYTLELHSHKATRKEVAFELARALTHHPQEQPEMPSAELARLARTRTELSARAQAVNEVREPFGRTLNNVIGRVAQLQGFPQAPHPQRVTSSLTPTEFADLISAAERLSRAWGPVSRGPSFVWRELDDVTLTSATRQLIDAQVESAAEALLRLQRAATDVTNELDLDLPRDLPGYRGLELVLVHLETEHPIPSEWLSEPELEPIVELREAREQQVAERAAELLSLSSAIGDRFREIAVGELARVEASIAFLEATPLGEVIHSMTGARCEVLLQGLTEAHDVLEETRIRASTVASSFGFPTDEGVTLIRARGLAELGELSTNTDRPEGKWLSPASIAAAQNARAVLGRLVDAFKAKREELGSTFTDEVLSLDIDGLITRFETVHQGLGKLRGSYRADKRSIAQVSRSERFTRDEVAMLSEARDWQRLGLALDQAEAQHAAEIGDHYYRREQTDFTTLDRALGVAQRALELSGETFDVVGLQKQLARGSEPTVDAHSNSAWILNHVSAWLESANDQLTPTLITELTKGSLSDGVQMAHNLTDPISAVLDALRDLESLVGHELTLDEAVSALEARTRLDQLEAELESTRPADETRLGGLYKGTETDWGALDAALAWADDLRALLGSAIDESVAARLLSADIPSGELSELLTGWLSARDAICSHFAAGRREELKQDFMTTVDDAHDLLSLLRETLADIEEWFEYAEARDQLIALGAQEPLEFCESQAVDAKSVLPVIERALLERWADSVIEGDRARIGTVRADQLANVVEEFRQLDQRVIELAAVRVIRACNERRPRTTLGPAGVIQREGMKQRKHMPVRRLLEEAGEVAQALKPCFMMTPLTVSQFLPAGIRFDVVIFDEASQVRPSDAINCIYRGAQLIVAGDEQQLPPTSFFDAAMADGDDEYDEDDFAEFESILKLCLGAGGLRQLPLRWHYRSHHEDLILYSNHSFYEGRLVSFPGAVHSAEDLGVELFHVADGVYRRGTSRDNPREASAVVDRMMHWAEWSLAHPDQAVTLGVVAFSEAQASAIEVELDRRRLERFDLDSFFQEGRLDGYFIKNLENVQGDERDVMIFSVGYGHDENRKFTMNFGPINRDGGRRRLNVAITRARRRVEVVSSVRAEDFPSSVDREGVRHLRRYLDFAGRGHAALALELLDQALDAESPFEEEVIRVIRSWGYEAVPQVGAAGYRVDIGIPHPIETGRYALGVECDGAMYHSSRVARDRDRLRQEVLEGLGWRLHRIWGTSWYRDRAGQEERLREAIEVSIAGGAPPPRRPRAAPAPVWVDDGVVEVEVGDRPPWAEAYAVSSPDPPRSRRLDMHDPAARSDLVRMIEEVVVVEGPISHELLLRRVREAWGVGRAGSRIRDAFDGAIQILRRRNRIVESDKGFWMLLHGDAGRVRTPDAEIPATRRSIDEVPPSELRVAIEWVVSDAIKAGRDELTYTVARLYGWNRRGSDIGAALDRAVKYLLWAKRLVRDGDYLRLPT